MVEVETGAERELLADQRSLAGAEHRREPYLGRQDAGTPLAPFGLDELAGVGPQPVGDLLAGAEPDPRDDRLARLTAWTVRVGGHDPEGVQRPVEDLDPTVEIGVAGLLEPRARLLSPGQRLGRRRRRSRGRC